MENFKNNPQMKNEAGQTTVRRFVHQKISIEHYGYQFTIHEDGKVKIVSPPNKEGEYDEITCSASLIFKIAQFLKGTRQTKYVAVSEVPETPETKE